MTRENVLGHNIMRSKPDVLSNSSVRAIEENVKKRQAAVVCLYLCMHTIKKARHSLTILLQHFQTTDCWINEAVCAAKKLSRGQRCTRELVLNPEEAETQIRSARRSYHCMSLQQGTRPFVTRRQTGKPAVGLQQILVSTKCPPSAVQVIVSMQHRTQTY